MVVHDGDPAGAVVEVHSHYSRTFANALMDHGIRFKFDPKPGRSSESAAQARKRFKGRHVFEIKDVNNRSGEQFVKALTAYGERAKLERAFKVRFPGRVLGRADRVAAKRLYGTPSGRASSQEEWRA